MGTPGSFDDYPPVMDSHQIAEMLLISDVQQVQRMAREGRIPAHRDVGAHAWRFDRHELIEWIRAEARVTPAE